MHFLLGPAGMGAGGGGGPSHQRQGETTRGPSTYPWLLNDLIPTIIFIFSSCRPASALRFESEMSPQAHMLNACSSAVMLFWEAVGPLGGGPFFMGVHIRP